MSESFCAAAPVNITVTDRTTVIRLLLGDLFGFFMDRTPWLEQRANALNRKPVFKKLGLQKDDPKFVPRTEL
jgi:hypothetical protein